MYHKLYSILLLIPNMSPLYIFNTIASKEQKHIIDNINNKYSINFISYLFINNIL